MLDVDEVLRLHETTVVRWHNGPIDNTWSGLLHIICQQHSYNFELWHQEDIARSPEATDAEIAQVKRNIDRLNQARNDHIEQIDDWISQYLSNQHVRLGSDARQHTETPGSAIDRLSIMSLRIYHYREQCERQDTESDHRQKVVQRLHICLEQRGDLAESLRQLQVDILNGRARHKTYRQFKMYNDPTLNPYLYRAAPDK